MALDKIMEKYDQRIISITFDDGWKSQFDYALPLLDQHGLKATFYVNPGKLSYFATKPNNPFMTITKIQELQNQGHEIGSHGNWHPDFTTLNDAQLLDEFRTSKNTLQSWGLTRNNFAYPHGKNNPHTDSVGRQFYQTVRTFPVPALIQLPNTLFSLPCWGDITDGSETLQPLKNLVDTVSAYGGWMIFCFHKFDSSSDTNTPPEIFHDFLDYIQQKGITVLKIQEALQIK
jgi:peptidoglycan/xylan/chitin deacetylase (PgdA/CDA1 family)